MSPAPTDDDGTALLDIVRERIRCDGPMPVDRYMHLCLADPEHGYWRRGGSIGAAGDFITAPEISQVFGELIGLWCAVVWQGMGRPGPLRLVELGPGRGTLMRDALRAAGRVPGFLEATTVHLVEVSAPLRELQRQTLTSFPPKQDPPPPCGEGFGVDEAARAAARVFNPARTSPTRAEGMVSAIAWHETLGLVPAGPAIVIANEFLDALPIRQLAFHGGAWCERVVTVDTSGALRFAAGARVECVAEAPAQPQPGAILELRAAEDELLRELSARPAPAVSLFMDYGPAAACYGDTLQAVRRHAYIDPLVCPGGADLTAHVQFASLADKARRAGLAADGPMTQSEFLGWLGIAERTARLMAANPARAGELEAATQRLMSPTGMGELFKVMAVRSSHLPPPPPFV